MSGRLPNVRVFLIGLALAGLVLAIRATSRISTDQIEFAEAANGHSLVLQGNQGAGCKQGGESVQINTPPNVSVFYVGSYGADGSCGSGFASFQQEGAAYFQTAHWSNDTDTIRVPQEIVRTLLVHVHGSAAGLGRVIEDRRLKMQMLTANNILHASQTGITLAANRSELDEPLGRATCAAAPSFRAGAGFVSGALNLFYVSVDGGFAEYCPPDVLLVDPDVSKDESLLHEVGHALGLPEFCRSLLNVMSSGWNRRDLTIGQIFLMNSGLSAWGDSTGFPRCSWSPPPTECTGSTGPWPLICVPDVFPASISPSSTALSRRQTLERYLENEHYQQSEFSRIMAFRETGLRELQAIRQGVPRAVKDLSKPMAALLNDRYQALVSYAGMSKQSVPLTRDEYFTAQLQSMRDRYDLKIARVAKALPRSVLTEAVLNQIRTTGSDYVKSVLNR